MDEVSEDYYIVEKIIEKKKVNKRKKEHWLYLVKWVDFPETENTWEPKENLENVKDML